MTNKVAVLISGRGSNLESLIVHSAKYNFAVTCVISNNASAPGLEFARSFSIPFYVVKNGEMMEKEIDKSLKNHHIDLICLAGFMKVLSADFISKWKDKIINIHPSLLPAFRGLNAQKQALEAGVKITGCTVHFVTSKLDAGKIIMQGAVPVLKDDTAELLSKRILRLEHKCYPIAVAKFFGNNKQKDLMISGQQEI